MGLDKMGIDNGIRQSVNKPVICVLSPHSVPYSLH